MPVVVDAGIGAPSQAAEALEMGADAVLVNTAIAIASDPSRMGNAFKMAVEAGREAFLISVSGASSTLSADHLTLLQPSWPITKLSKSAISALGFPSPAESSAAISMM